MTAMSGSRILRVSTAIFHSSLVEPSSMKMSICGIALNAICLVNCSGLIGSLTKIARVWLNNSSIAARPAPGGRLIGRHHHPLDAGEVVQRLQRHHHLDRRAVRVGDDVALLVVGDRLRIDLGHDQRHVGLHAELRGVVDHDGTRLGRARRELRRHLGAGRGQHDIDAAEIVGVEVLDLEDVVLAKRNLLAERARGGEAPRPRRPGKSRSASVDNISRPTLPVAPTTATLKPIMQLRSRKGLGMAADLRRRPRVYKRGRS